MKRREFNAHVGGAVAWSLSARAQQSAKVDSNSYFESGFVGTSGTERDFREGADVGLDRIFRDAARVGLQRSYVGKQRKRTHPENLPLEQPTKVEIAIGLKAAKSLGLTLPSSLFTRADEVIA